MKGKSGTVALVGRPNVGKSTLLNSLLKEKLAIVSDKPQTTRHRIVGILSEDGGQMVFYDTPGIHRPLHRMNQRMVQVALDSLNEADLVCLLVDAAARFGGGDRYLLDLVGRSPRPKLLLLNKIDRVKKSSLLPLMEHYSREGLFEEIVPLSALEGDGTDLVLDLLWRRLPVGEPLYDPELLTLHAERYLVAERIREKVLKKTRQELPFATAVVIDDWDEETGDEDALVRIAASVLVERPGQKKILVGHQGQMVKEIGTAARLDLEEFLGRRVFLDLHIRVEREWRENPRILAALESSLRADLSRD